MAEIYPLGTNRIFYRVSPRSNPETVTVDLIEDNLDPELISVILSESLTPVPSVPGLYYFEAEFLEVGTYIAVFYEDGVEKASQAFSTRKLSVRDVTITGSRFLGNNVING